MLELCNGDKYLHAEGYSKSFNTGNVCVHSSAAPYKAGADGSVNEDAFLVQQIGANSTLIAVADGVGGHARGHEASALIIEYLLGAFSTINHEGNSQRESILDAIEQCNLALLDKGYGSATTLVVALISDNVVRPYHVGDSSLLVTGQRGLLKLKIGKSLASGVGCGCWFS